MIAIKTKDLCKSFKEVKAVKSLNLEIADGEFFALLGINGAGKTTCIRMLCCLTKCTSGEAWLMENSVVSDIDKVKDIINISPQETAVAGNLTVRENLEFIAEIYGESKANSTIKANEMLEKLSLEDVASKRAKTLSGGYARRLSIAMALISNPKILFLDEPTLGLDVIARKELWEVIKSLKGKITIVLTTHYLEEAVALSDRIGIMANGELKAVGTADELMKKSEQDNFEDAFVTIANGKGELK